MILPDVNLLLYAYNQDDPNHVKARIWLEKALNDAEPVCFTWHTLMGFLRISTNPRIFPRALRTHDVLTTVEALIANPGSIIVNPGADHFQIFRKLVNEAGISGAKLMDAHIAAVALEHGATLVSADRDFRVFDGLKLINPFAPKKK